MERNLGYQDLYDTENSRYTQNSSHPIVNFSSDQGKSETFGAFSF